MTRWLVTVEQRYSHKKTNIIITTEDDLPTIEEIQKIIRLANDYHFDANCITAHVITFMQKLN